MPSITANASASRKPANYKNNENPTNVLEINHITKLSGSQRALDDVSFAVKPGEIVGLLGPNGAGKSTLMKIITCFIPPSEGDAKVCGYSIFVLSYGIGKKLLTFG